MSKTNHEDRYQFPEPKSMKEARKRKRELERDILNIDRQLRDPERRDRKGKLLSAEDYMRWSKGARSSLIFKKTEHAYIKDWMADRRRKIQANEIDIYDADDSRELLVRCRLVLRRILDGEDMDNLDLGSLFNVIDQHLQHAA